MSAADAMLGIVIERPISFGRLRLMRCGSCTHEWPVTGEWIDRFNQGFETCPECGVDCTVEQRPDFAAADDDPARDDRNVRGFSWYHSTTHDNWPNTRLEPASHLTHVTRQRMESMIGPGAVARWASAQKTKALHIGTYEAAIENMLRRVRDQDDAPHQFYLYRVCLRDDAAIEPGVSKEPTNFVGDTHLADHCAAGMNVLRYVNVHEDASSISLAIELSAIERVQGIPIPLSIDLNAPLTTAAIARLERAATLPTPPPRTRLEQLSRSRPSPVALEARAIEQEIAAQLPLPIRERFEFFFCESRDRSDLPGFVSRLFGIAQLVTDPAMTLSTLNAQEWRTL